MITPRLCRKILYCPCRMFGRFLHGVCNLIFPVTTPAPAPKQDLAHFNHELLPIGYRTLDPLLARFLSIMTVNVSRDGCEQSPFNDKVLRNAAYEDFRQSQYTGFTAAFYPDGQIAHFTYFIDGRCDRCPQLHVQHGRREGWFSIQEYYAWDRALVGYRYHDGMAEDVNPWSDGIPGTPVDFEQWMEESIASIATFGLEQQLVETDQTAHELVAALGIRDQTFLHRSGRRLCSYIGYRSGFELYQRRLLPMDEAHREVAAIVAPLRDRLQRRYAETFGVG